MSLLERVRGLLRRLGQLPLVQSLGIQLIIGLVFSLALLALFGNIAENVVEQDTLVQIDTELANALHAQASPGIIAFYRALSFVGMQGVWVLSLIVAALLAVRRRWLYLGVWAAALIGGILLNQLLKALFARPRPVFVDPIALEQTYSFPSGHSMLSLIAFGMVAFFLWRLIASRSGRILAVFAAVLLVILIGISRMALGVHYLSDVLGGFAAGGVWLVACLTACLTIERRRGRIAPETPALITQNVPAGDEAARPPTRA